MFHKDVSKGLFVEVGEARFCERGLQCRRSGTYMGCIVRRVYLSFRFHVVVCGQEVRTVFRFCFFANPHVRTCFPSVQFNASLAT